MAPYLLTATLRYRASLHRILISSQMFPFILNYLRGVQPPLRDMSEVCLVFAFIELTRSAEEPLPARAGGRVLSPRHAVFYDQSRARCVPRRFRSLSVHSGHRRSLSQ